MLTDKQCRELIEKQEKEECEEIGNIVEKDLENMDKLSENCFNAIMDNEIYIISNEEFNKNKYIDETIAKEKFDEGLKENLIDLQNSVFYLDRIRYGIGKSNGFEVFFLKCQSENTSKITVKIIESLSDYISKVLYIKENDSKKVFYRGHGSWKYKLVPGIYRNNNLEILKNESSYIKEIISSYPRYFKECKSALDFLSVLQHNGFPTRLLDFSENPLIALYMACNNENDSEADVIRISVPKEKFKYYDSDTVSVLSNIALAEDDFSVEFDEDISVFNKQDSIKKFVHLIRNEKPFFKAEINPNHLKESILFVKPKQDFERISQQSGLFALFGMENEKNKMPRIERMDPPCDIEHLIIPKKFKKRIVAELSHININEATIYRDLEHVCNFYTKKSNNKEIEKYVKNKEKKLIF